MNATEGALAGIRVLDLTRVLAGPTCTMMLGDMGADVIKVEPPTGDDTRGWGPPFVEGEAVYFLSANRNKRSITLNLAVPAGQKLLAALIRKADVVVDNFKVGTLPRWGFPDAWFEEHAPRAVRCSITGYGPTGPKAALPGYDFVLQAESGLMSICGEPDGRPVRYGVAIVDICTGMLASNAILAALNARHRTGRGQRVDLSLFETSLHMLVNIAENLLAAGRDGGRFGNGHPSIVPYTSFQAKDAMMALAVGTDAQFAKCAAVLGHPEWAADPRFANNRARVANRDLLESGIAAALAEDTADAWLAKLKAVGVPCGRINSVAEAFAEPQAAARAMIETVDHPVIGALKLVGMPYKFSDTPAAVRLPPPLLGEHTEEILMDELGLDAAAIAGLRDGGVI
jgi:crotonobetainyl-CoA:carnitine CoA-transferase CaiB-like acyl-CoA transferase